MEIEEIWKSVPEWSRYEVSNTGKVRSLFANKIRELVKMPDTCSYLVVKLCKNMKCKKAMVHRLVALAFIPNPENKPQVNHIDGDKYNNHVSNLEWVTGKENCIHAFKIGLNKPHLGEAHGMAKISEADVLEIRKSNDSGVALAKRFGIHKSRISQIRSRQSWSHVLLLILFLCNSIHCLSQESTIPNWVLDSLIFEAKLSRQCYNVTQAQASELEKQGLELIATGKALSISQKSNETLSALLRNSRESQGIQGLQFQKDLNSERRKTKRWRKIGIIEGVGLIGLLILML